MQDRVFIAEYLAQYYDELTPLEFYRGIFPTGELATHKERQRQGRYNAIAVELLPKEDTIGNAKRYLLTDELDYLEEIEKKDNFIIISPISYAGRSREAKNARFIYAMAIDLDGIETEFNLAALFRQIEYEWLPRPTYIVWSGTGCHLYWKFIEPIPCFKNITKQLSNLKQDITKKIWNKDITSLSDKVQLQSLFQGFRAVGTMTKGKNRVRAFETGKAIDIEYLNDFCMYEKSKVKDIVYKSKLSLADAKELYPEWYQKRIIEKKPKEKYHWTAKEDLYKWWLNRVKNEAIVGHRYYCLLCLAIYAKKSGVSREQLEADAFSLFDTMERLTIEEGNHFKREDILAALEAFNDNFYTFPIDTITQLTQIPIEKNKRNGRKREQHIEYMNTMRDFKKRIGEPMELGRPSKESIVVEWRRQHPIGTITECAKETGMSRTTIYKYWSDK